MKKALVGILMMVSCHTAAFAVEPVKALVLDSGTDFTHPVLQPLANPNAVEEKGTAGVDDDENGYIDDILGWNFVDNVATLVDLKNTPPSYEEVLECLRLLGILQAKGKEALTAEEFKFLVDHYNNPKFWPWVEFVGGWAHGTHCAGIIAENNPAVKMNAIRHIPTGQAPERIAKEAIVRINHLLRHDRPQNLRRSRTGGTETAATKQVSLAELEALFTQLGQDYCTKIRKEAEYLASFKARVVNCSFGSDNSTLLKVFKQNMVQEWGWGEPTDAQVQEVVSLFVGKALLERDKELFGKSPETLFFIAAGNSSEHLDGFLSSPNDVDIPNKIVVAATMENRKLADFSCFGVNKVDVAVPGVGIYSTVPNGQMAYMSGTSMACPMAARFGTMVMQENPALNALEVKKILLGTVDKKDWLADKVRTGGIINPQRAVFAAALTKKGKPLADAIAEAKVGVPDMVISTKSKFKGPDMSDKLVRKLYFSGVF
jgi:subtilisin family serine protease